MLEIPMLDDDETLLAVDATPRRPRMHPSAVTDRRIILTWRTADAGRQREWLHDSVWFHEVTAWRVGHTHDERPVIVVEHPAHERLEHVPAHRVLWFEWGNAVGPVTHTSTELRYPNRRDPAFLAVLEGLRGTGAPESEPFEERPPGTRQERLGRGPRRPRPPGHPPRSLVQAVRRGKPIVAGVLLAMLLPACPLIGVVERPEETTYDGVDFALTCESVEPDLVGTALEIRTNVSQVTASRDIISLDPHDAFAFRQYTGCGNGFDYDDGWFLAVSDQMSDRRRAEIAERVAPFR